MVHTEEQQSNKTQSDREQDRQQGWIVLCTNTAGQQDSQVSQSELY